MNAIWRRIGILAFWATLPALIVYLGRSERTRVVITHGRKVVVVKGWLGSGRWHLPGGGLHKGEAPLAGLLRETAEETGLHLDGAKVQFLFSEQYRHQGMRYFCHYFAAELPEEALLRAQPYEISDLAWVEPTTLNAKNSNPDVLVALAHLKGKSSHA
jgi:8-oxo-dGTP pyrophosphatase MutT (NUDIX family)